MSAKSQLWIAFAAVVVLVALGGILVTTGLWMRREANRPDHEAHIRITRVWRESETAVHLDLEISSTSMYSTALANFAPVLVSRSARRVLVLPALLATVPDALGGKVVTQPSIARSETDAAGGTTFVYACTVSLPISMTGEDPSGIDFLPNSEPVEAYIKGDVPGRIHFHLVPSAQRAR
jgi:hypothetical protein